MHRRALLASLFLAGCSGDLIGGLTLASATDAPPAADPAAPRPTPSEPTPDRPAGPVDAPHFACESPGAHGALPAMRRLSRAELENTLEDLFGADVVDTLTTLGDYAVEPFDVHRMPSGAHPSRSSVSGLVETMADVAERVSTNPTWLRRVAPACLVAGGVVSTSDRACATAFVTEVGLRVLRRPLTAPETAAWVATLQTSTPVAPSPAERVALVLGQLLTRPEFLFLLTHQRTVEPGGTRVDAWTVASRLSYAAIGSMPDAELFEAARLGQLDTQAQRLLHARRLLTRPATATTVHAGRRFVRSFFANWLYAFKARQADAFYSQRFGVNGGTINAAFLEEAMRFGEHVTFDSGASSFAELMTSAAAFPPDADTAKVMGTAVSRGSGDPRIVSDWRRGLFLRPLLLVSSEPRTSLIHRGAVFVTQLSCVDLGPIPTDADAVAAAEKEKLDLLELSGRQLATAVTSQARCAGCHAAINPAGFVFERFGALGEQRPAEEIFDQSRALVRTLPIEDSAELVLDGAAQRVEDPRAFAEVVSRSSQVKACMTRQLFRQARRALDTPADRCHLASVEAALRAGRPLLDVFATNAASEDLSWEP
ncbi:MAG: DUF1588 domain-containing protein [Myxococcaceae bacterium]|nr:DUF1588 domain-containing protein [Myxococcaceae bacterium]